MESFDSWIPAFVVFVCSLGPAFAHDCNHHGHHDGYRRDCGQSYASSRQSVPVPVATIENLEGRIAEVIYLPGSSPGNAMVELRLQSGSGAEIVRLAPASYLKQNRLAIREGDKVAVKGYRVAGMNGYLLVATEVRKGDTKLSLRDSQGRPAW